MLRLIPSLILLFLVCQTGLSQVSENFPVSDPRSAVDIPRRLIATQFKVEHFRFVRIKYSAGTGDKVGNFHWRTDFPDADTNMAAQMTGFKNLKVDIEPQVMSLTDAGISDCPFIYMAEPSRLQLTVAEVDALRRYLLGGGFLMLDDFWGEAEWERVVEQMKKVFPDRKPVDLPLEHPIFHAVFDLGEKPQVCSIHVAMANRGTAVTWEREDAKTVHYSAIFDDSKRLMVLLCHNTDLADGWERSNVDQYYFDEFSKKKAYPMGVNILYYALTH